MRQAEFDLLGLARLYDGGMELKDWVRAARAHKKWTQQQLGDAVARTKANVAHWESGKHPPSYSQVTQIAALTGYPMPDALPGATGGKASTTPRQVGTRAELTPAERQVLDDLNDLPKEDADQLMREIHVRAEKIRRHHEYLMRRDGITPTKAATRASGTAESTLPSNHEPEGTRSKAKEHLGA